MVWLPSGGSGSIDGDPATVLSKRKTRVIDLDFQVTRSSPVRRPEANPRLIDRGRPGERTAIEVLEGYCPGSRQFESRGAVGDDTLLADRGAQPGADWGSTDSTALCITNS